MNFWRLIFRNLSARPGLTLASVAGAAVGMAIIVGSLVVGDSVRATLRGVALRRLGPVTTAVVSEHALDADLARRVALAGEFSGTGLSVSAISIAAATATGTGDGRDSAGRPVTLLGVDQAFWGMRWRHAEVVGAGPQAGGAWIGRELAESLGIGTGDDIVLTIGLASSGAGDSVFGRRDLALARLRLTVGRVLDGGAANFSIDAPGGRAAGGNVFVDLAWLNRQLDTVERAGMLLVGETGAALADEDAAAISSRVRAALPGQLSLRDYGLRLITSAPVADRAAGGELATDAETARRLVIESERIVLDGRQLAALAEAARRPGAELMPSSAYLINSVRKVASEDGAAGRRAVPYVMLAGIDFSSPLVQLRMASGGADVPAIAAGEVLVNSHLAEELNLSPGDDLEVVFYEVLSDGSLGERDGRLRVAGVVGMAGSGADRLLVPHVEGLTDASDMRTWSPPFPVDQRLIEDRDEAYWDSYGAAPRMLASLETVRDIWRQALSPATAGGGERYVTGLQMQMVAGETVDALEAGLAADLPSDLMGVVVRDLRGDALAASRGSSDYTGLFIGLGIFLVAASALLVGLLGRLNVQRRASQTGLLLAVGFTRRQCSKLLAGEAVVMTMLAGLLAAPLGVGYGAGLMAGLNVLWPETLAGLSIELHVSWLSVIGGLAFGGLAAGLALLWGLAGLRGRSVLELLAGWRCYSASDSMDSGPEKRPTLLGLLFALLLLGLGAAVVAGGFAGWWSTVATFFAGGVLLLGGGLMFVWNRMALMAPAVAGVGWGLNRLAWQWLGRNRVRSMLTMSLIATAAFALAAVAANRRDIAAADSDGFYLRAGGAGGYHLKIETQLPLPVPLAGYLSRQMASGEPRGDEALLRAARIESLRVQSGDDISCLNIAQPQTPRIVGAGPALIEGGGFRLSAYLPVEGLDAAQLAQRPLSLLEAHRNNDDGAIAVMGDEASLRWILGRNLGERFEIDTPRGPLSVRIVGMLAGSIWQSELLMSEADFVAAFGAEGGYGLFLVQVPESSLDATAAALGERLRTVGVRITPTQRILAEFASVQNAYLATFQTLGGLGLALGMLGLMTVMMRGAEERSRELALLRAIGFNQNSLLRLMVTESGMLLTMGLAIGTLAALAAVLPQVLASGGTLPLVGLTLMLAAIWTFGLASCAVAGWRISRRNLMVALRSE